MADAAQLAVHRHRRPFHDSAESLSDRLVPEADPEQRHPAGGRFDQAETDAGLVRRAGAGRQHDRLRLEGQRLFRRQGVVAPHLAACAQIAQEVHEIESEAVVVVDQKDHGASYVRRDGPPVNRGRRPNQPARRQVCDRPMSEMPI